MGFCNNCGAVIPNGANACPSCNTPVAVLPQQPQQAQYQQPQQAQYQQPQQAQYQQPQQAQYQQPQQAQYQQPQQAPQAGANDGNEKLMCILAYIGPLFLIPLFAAKDSRKARFHTGQGATLCAFEVAYAILSTIITVILNVALPKTIHYTYWGTYTTAHPAATVVSTIFWVLEIAFVVLAVIGIIAASKGQMVRLPVIGKIDIISKLIDKD